MSYNNDALCKESDRPHVGDTTCQRVFVFFVERHRDEFDVEYQESSFLLNVYPDATCCRIADTCMQLSTQLFKLIKSLRKI